MSNTGDYKLPLINGENLSPYGYGDSQQAGRYVRAVATTERGRPKFGKQQSGLHGNMESGAEMTSPKRLEVMLNIFEVFDFLEKTLFVSKDLRGVSLRRTVVPSIRGGMFLKFNSYVSFLGFKNKPRPNSMDKGKCLEGDYRPLTCLSPFNVGRFFLWSKRSAEMFLDYSKHTWVAHRYNNLKLIVRCFISRFGFTAWLVFDDGDATFTVNKSSNIREHFFVEHRRYSTVH